MGSIPVANSSPVPRWRPPLFAALLAALIAVVVTLVAILIWPASGPTGTVVGQVDGFTPGQPVHFEEHSVWVVRGIEDRFLAFSDDDPRTAGEHDCRVEWNPARVVEDEQGVFETCGGYMFHPGGPVPVFPGVAPDGPSFYPASVSDGNVVVDFSEPYCNRRGFYSPGPCRALLPGAAPSTAFPQLATLAPWEQ